jgi:periplasmic divalent cation tolerance protein
VAEYIQVSTTTASKADAERIARRLVDERLAACVQIIGPITSTFRWQGAVETAEEFLCLIKTRAAAYARLEQRIHQLHVYEVPEIIALPITAGSEAYLGWIDGEASEA